MSCRGVGATPTALADEVVAPRPGDVQRLSKAFTLQNFHEPILINEPNSRILQRNCVRCHGEVVGAIVADNKTDVSCVKCVGCHQAIGHGPVI